MKKQFALEDLDCANCAQKMEDAIRKLDGVEDVQVNFLRQTLTLTADDEQFDKVLKAAAKAIRKIEPDCRIKL